MTSDELLQSIRSRQQIPVSTKTFNDERLLAMADEEMSMSMVPTIVRLHENYLLYTEEVEVDTTKSRYIIPYRAMGNRLKDLAFQDTSGAIIELTKIEIDCLPDYSSGSFSANPVYYILNNQIVFLSAPTSGSLLFTYYLRPSSLVKLSKIAVITAIDFTTGEVAVSSVPSTFTGSSLFDFYTVRSPHATYRFDITATGVDSDNNLLTFDPDDLSEFLAVGDHISLATQCAIPQIPSDLHSMLAQQVAVKYLEAAGDTEGLKNANASLAKMELNSGTLIDNRVESSPKKILNRKGFLRQSRLGTRWR